MNTVGYWFYWLFLYMAACVLLTLLGVSMVSSFVYYYDHSHHLAHYYETLNTWEGVATIVCTGSGLVYIGLLQLWDYRKRQAISSKQAQAVKDDASIWPPPPKAE